MSLPRSQVVVVGPGRVGTVLAAALARAGHRIVGVAGGSQESRRRFLDRHAGVREAADPVGLVADAELVLVTTPDDAVADIVSALAAADVLREGQRVVHVSGALGLAPLRRAALAGAGVAACHPAQTVPSTTVSPDILVGTAWAVTAGPDDLGWAREFVLQTGGDPYDVADDARVLYHAGLVVGSNAVGAATSVARQLLLGARVERPEAFLGPLIAASVENVLRDGARALTGPVVRGDAGTVRSHLETLGSDVPSLLAAYRRLTEVVLGQVQLELDDAAVAALRAVLDDVGATP